MKRLIAVCLLILIEVSSAAQSEDKTTIALGGPRKVVAEIAQDGDDLIVEIRMLSVRTFDNATNLCLSREKSRQYAQAALAKFLLPDAKGRVTFTLSGATVEKATLEGKHYRLTMRVPRNGVAQKEVAEKPAKTSNDVTAVFVEEPATTQPLVKRPAKINLFEVKGDYAETERLLFESFKTVIPTLPDEPIEDQRKLFYSAIADLEEQADQSFDVLIAEMRKNKLLLTIEANDLVKQVERDRAELMDLLKNAVEAATPPPSNK